MLKSVVLYSDDSRSDAGVVFGRLRGDENREKSPKKSLDIWRNLLYYSYVLRQGCAAGFCLALPVGGTSSTGFILDSYSLEDQQAAPSRDTF